MANEIYDSTWWGNTIDTASSIGTSTEMIQGQFNMLTSNQPNLVTNGDFATDSDWTLEDGWSIGDGKAVVTNAPALYQRLTQSSLNFTLNSNYKISITCSEHSSGFVYLRKPRGVESDTDLRIDNVGTFVFTLKALTELDEFALAIGSLGTNLTITNISVKEVRATTVEASKCLADAIHRIGIQDIQN